MLERLKMKLYVIGFALVGLLTGCAPSVPLFAEYSMVAPSMAHHVGFPVYQHKREVGRPFKRVQTVIVQDHTLTQESEALLAALVDQALELGGDGLILRTDFQTTGVAYTAAYGQISEMEVVSVPIAAGDVIVFK